MPKVEVDGGHISYRVFGSGTPIVFVPPPVVGTTTFYRQVEHLSHLFRLILLDLPGHGHSAPSARPCTYGLVADDIQHVMNHLEIEKAVICGYSMGGSVVFEFLRLYPNRALSGISISGLSEATNARVQLQLGASVSICRAGAIGPFAAALAAVNADTVNAFRYMYRAGQKASAYDVSTMFEFAQCYNCTNDLPHLGIPVRWIVGGKDSHLYSQATKLRDKLPKDSVVVVQNAHHQIPTKNYRELNREIAEFVDRLS